MSGNQEPRISLPTWQRSDFNAAIPIKKRKYFVQPQFPALEEAQSAPFQKSPHSNDHGDSSVGKSPLDSSNADENLKMIGGSWKSFGEPISSFQSVSVRNSEKAESIGNKILDQIRVKVEETSFPIRSSPLAGFEIPSSSNIPGSSLNFSMGKLPMGAEHPGAVVTSDVTGMKTILKTHDIESETCGKENLIGKCQTEASAGPGIVSREPGCKTKKNSPHWESEEPAALNLSLRNDVCAPSNTGSVSVCTKSDDHSGVNRSNWDLNTTMDAWEDDLDLTKRVKTAGAFLNGNRSLHDKETSSCRDTTVNAKSVSVKQKEIVGFKSPTAASMQFDHQVNPTCSLSLGPSSFTPIEKSPFLSATTLVTRDACTIFSRPIMIAGNVNSVNPKTVKSEVIEENVRQKTESAQVCPIGLTSKGVKQEVGVRFSQEIIPSDGILKKVDPISIKAEPNNFTQSEVSNRKDGTLNHSHTPIMQPNKDLDLPTSSMPYQKDKSIPCSSGINDALTINQGVQLYPDYSTLKENSGQSSRAASEKLCEVLKHGAVHMTYLGSGHGDHNLNASGVNVTSLTEEKTLDDCKTRNSRGTDELSVINEENIILAGKEPEEELYSYRSESDYGHELSREIKKEIGKRNLCDDAKVQGPAAIFVESNDVSHAECGGSETEQRDINVSLHGDYQNIKYVEAKESQPALLGNKGNEHLKACSTSSSTNKFKKYTVVESCLKLVEMESTEVQIMRLTPELQSVIFDGSGENEGRIVQDDKQSTHQVIHAGKGESVVSTVSGGNTENPEIVDNSSPVSYKAEIFTIDNDPPAELSDGSQNRMINPSQVSNKSPIKTLESSGSFAPLRMERDRLHDLPFEPRKYLSRWSDDSYKFSHEKYRGKIMRSPRLNYMPERRRVSDKTESNLHDPNTKNFEFDNHGNTRRGGAFMSNFNRGRRPANDEATHFPHSFPRRTPNFSFTHRGPTNKEDASSFNGSTDGEKFARGLQCNTEPMSVGPIRPYQGRNGSFARGRTQFSNNTKRAFHGSHSRSPIRSRERSDDPSSSFRNRSHEEFSEHSEFSHRRPSSGYRKERISSPDHSNYSRELVGGRHNSAIYLNRPSNAGRGRGYTRGRGYARGRGYTRGRGYGRDGISFRKPYDRVAHRYHGNLNNSDPRERVDFNDNFFEGPTHSERFGVDGNVERRRFGYRHDDTNSFKPSFNNDGCAHTNVENDPDAVRFGQDPDIEIDELGSLVETDGKNKNSTDNASGRTKNMEGETSTQ